MDWSELAGAQPRLAGLASERLLNRGVVLLMTWGAPRANRPHHRDRGRAPAGLVTA